MAVYVGDNTPNLYFGGVENDDISGLGGNDSLDGGAGRDLIDGGGGSDQLVDGGDLVSDTLKGGAVSDAVYAGVRDKLYGGGGADYFQLFLDTDADYDLDFSNLASGGVFTFADGGRIDGFESGTIFLGGGDDAATASIAMDIRLSGGDGADTLTGRSRNDQLDGGAALVGDADELRGAGGDDQLSGGAGDTLDGGGGLDYVNLDLSQRGVAYDVNLNPLASGGRMDFGDGTRLQAVEQGFLDFGFNGDRVRTGAVDGFIINGRDGDDSLTGGGRDDELEGGIGDDVIDGGAGQSDGAYFMTALVGVSVSLAIAGAQDTGVGMDTLIRIENIVGSAHDDGLTGDGGDNFLGGLGGDDVLVGGGGADTLTGGYDSAFDSDADRLTGGGGADLLRGGDDADTFVYLRITDSSNAAADRIVDLADEDLVDLSAIDADTGAAGNQAFVLVGAFTANAGEATLTFDGALTSLRLDVDGDGAADATITMDGDHTGFTNFAL